LPARLHDTFPSENSPKEIPCGWERKCLTVDRWRILVVDDDEDTCDLIRMSLEQDFDVLTLTNPQETPEILDVLEPDLIVLDVMMPKVSGFQLADYLKKNPAYRNIPIVFLSAKGTLKDQKYGYSLGASLYLTKPFEPSRLVKNVRLMLSGAAAQRKLKQSSMHEVRQRLAHLMTCRVSAGVAQVDPLPSAEADGDVLPD